MGGVKKKVRSVTRATGRTARSGRPKGKAPTTATKRAPVKAGRRSPAKAGTRKTAKTAKQVPAKPAKRVAIAEVRGRNGASAPERSGGKTRGRRKDTKSTKDTKVAKGLPKGTPMVVRIRDLDPYRMCGPGTSVERLIRVDTLVSGSPEAHLVYLDRHGWYCEHGRACPAVGHARRHALHAPDARR